MLKSVKETLKWITFKIKTQTIKLLNKFEPIRNNIVVKYFRESNDEINFT